ncbi:MAG TPA: beta-N-acetylhexosaminidase [Casimicrobiaceae bacterium]|jgi:beta-N-acetylhexosaminidase|nr:beta-N-acetylhexosaminidase [Casimicrobiaceae bacterium]
MMVGIRGKVLDASQAEFLRRNRIRAVVLFRSNLGSEAEVRALTAALRRAMGSRALIGIDQEGGAVIRATFLPNPPAAMALGAAGSAVLAEEVGAAVARGVKSLGFNWNFAPVTDVSNNPANPVIAARSFSSNPSEVVRLAGAWMRGALREGVACCIKHFPGHGDTRVDSHLELPVVDKSMQALRALELKPFRELKSKAPAIMTAHIVYPRIDPQHPATLSRKLLRGLLRETWGYKGVIITDSLVMKAIHRRYGHDRAAVLALQAGADMVMALGTRDEQAAALQAIAGAIADGSLARAELRRSRARLDALAQRYPARQPRYAKARRGADERLMERAWALSLTRIGDARPPPLDQPLRVVTQRSVPTDGVSEAGPSGESVAALFQAFRVVEIVQVDDLQNLDWDRLPRDGRATVLASNQRARYGENSRRWRPRLHLALWNPFQVLDVPAPALVSWGFADGALMAVRAWLEGRAAAPGRSPVPLAPGAPAGRAPSLR